MYSFLRSLVYLIPSALAVLPHLANAHEVYVLDATTILNDIAVQSPNPLLAYQGNETQFFLWAFICFVIFSTIMCASLFHLFEKTIDPYLFSLKKFAHPIARITVGMCLIACGIYSGLFGPELPFVGIFGGASDIMRIVFILLGFLAIIGVGGRYIGYVSLLIVVYAFFIRGSYMLTYSNYVGEFCALAILGGGFLSLDHTLNISHTKGALKRVTRTLEPYAFLVLRVLFGFSVMFAALFAKLWHSQLALDVISQYHLTLYFHFDPLFTVLGALIIEVSLGIMIMLGIAIRWSALFLLFWLTLSLLYFGESVWPHIVLAGLALALFCHGYDKYSLEGYILKRRHGEPVL